MNKKIQLFPQVNFGEIFKCVDDDKESGGYYAMQCKRADFIITDKKFNPIMVIEYNGGIDNSKGAHYQGDWYSRDEIKKQVCSSAGVEYVVITKQKRKVVFY